MVAVPQTATRQSHALVIRVGGRTIGAIHSWGPSTTRTVDAEWEIDSAGHGMPVDQVPQTVERREVRIARYDLYPIIMEQVFGSPELVVLADQARPFSCREVWTGPPLDPFGGAQNLAGSAFGGVQASLAPFGFISGVQSAQEAVAQAAAGTEAAIAAAATSKVGRAVTSLLGKTSTNNRLYEYQGCYFTDIGRTIDAKSDRVISVDATITWLRRRLIDSAAG